LRDGFQAAFNEIALSAKSPAQIIYTAFTDAFTGIQNALTGLILGQKNALRDLAKNIEESLAKSAVQTLTTKAAGAIGNAPF
jgi:phage-related minor tail protein